VSDGTNLAVPRPGWLIRAEHSATWAFIVLGSSAALAGAAGAVGFLPPEGRAWVGPLLTATGAAGAVLAAFHVIRRCRGPGVMRWSRSVLGISGVCIAVGHAGALLHLWAETVWVAPAFLGGGGLFGLALLLDGGIAYRRGTLGRLGLLGAVSGGIGVLGFLAAGAVSGVAGRIATLLAFGCMAFAGTVFFRVRSRLNARVMPAPLEQEAFPRSFPPRPGPKA
jgi:hypothetical protein